LSTSKPHCKQFHRVDIAGSFTLAYLIARMWVRPLPAWVQAGNGVGMGLTFLAFGIDLRSKEYVTWLPAHSRAAESEQEPT